MKKTLFVLGAAVLSLVLTAGDCKKASGPDDSGTPPKPPSVKFSSPGTQDACSQQANGIITFANSNTTLLEFFAALPPIVNGNDYTWSIPGSDSLTINVKATRQSDGSFTWEVRYNGVQDGITYANKLILAGTTTSADGAGGSMTAYDDTSSAVIGTFSWTTSGSDVTGTLIEKDSSQVDTYKIVMTSNSSTGAGTVTTYNWSGSAWVQEFYATWTSQGGQAICS